MQKDNYQVVITQDKDLVKQAQEMRATIFLQHDDSTDIDKDFYDDRFEHLVVLCNDEVIGTYRLIVLDKNTSPSDSYTQTEFDISALMNSGCRLLELGRSCVHPDHRNGLVISALWLGIGKYLTTNSIDYMLGCVSFEGDDVAIHQASISYLYHNHLSQDPLAPKALHPAAVDILATEDVPKDQFKKLPPLIKGYIRTGVSFVQDVVIDSECKTVDMCALIKTEDIASRYLERFAKD